MKDYCVYILSNSAGTTYIGLTGNLDQRIFDHDAGRDPDSFASRYKLNRLNFMETYPTAAQAINREKQIKNPAASGGEFTLRELKGWSRAKKLKLIREQNPEFRDFSADYGLLPPRLPLGG